MDCAHHLQLQEHAPVLMLTMPQILKMRDAKRFVASAAAFVLTFVRPAGFTGLDSVSYAILVAVVVLVLGLPPLVLYGMRKPGWDLRSDAERNTDTYDVLVNPEY